MKFNPKELLGSLGVFQAQMQGKLRALRVQASAGGNMVAVTCDGYGDVTEVHIDPEVLKEPDATMLEDLVRAAVNEAQSRARAQARQELQNLVGLPLAGLLGAPDP